MNLLLVMPDIKSEHILLMLLYGSPETIFNFVDALIQQLRQLPQTGRKILIGDFNMDCGSLTFKRPMLLSYRNQSVDLLCKSTDWFLYDRNIGR